VGELARRLLLDPDGFPHATIAEMVNTEISGSAATDKSVRWYASKMRKGRIEVPARQAIRNDHIWITDRQAAAEWLGVRVVTPGSKE
jgi:hypothetical protein